MTRVGLSRRRFLTIAGSGALWMTTGCRSGGGPGRAIRTLGSAATATPIPTGDRVLVLVQLLGGNDGLGTIVPLDGRYHDARPTLGLADEQLVMLPGLDGHGLHPSLAPLATAWADGDLAFVAGVGFESQSRSHFESRDVWWRGGASGTDGWLARWMQAAAVDRPDEPMEALALGVGPRALAGSGAAAVADPSDLEWPVPEGMTAADFESFLLAVSQQSADETALEQAARSAPVAALSTQKILAEIADPSADDPYDPSAAPGLALQLRTAASLLALRPGLRVVTVGVEGFDTHADQAATHATLLSDVASAVSGFWADLAPADRARTMVLTTSEFGRRVAENGSGGTDHGRAGVHLVLGGGVNGGQLIGNHGLGSLTDGDLPITVPAVDVFADALRWLGGPVREVLGVDPPATGLT